MKSLTTPDFWASYAALPPDVKTRPKLSYRLWQRNPRHPSLRFKKIRDVWCIRVGSGHRALSILRGDTFYWFWIGDHNSYLRLVSAL